jgi:hypothetical protein
MQQTVDVEERLVGGDVVAERAAVGAQDVGADCVDAAVTGVGVAVAVEAQLPVAGVDRLVGPARVDVHCADAGGPEVSQRVGHQAQKRWGQVARVGGEEPEVGQIGPGEQMVEAAAAIVEVGVEVHVHLAERAIHGHAAVVGLVGEVLSALHFRQQPR